MKTHGRQRALQDLQVIHTPDRETFLKARPPELPVRVVRMATSQLIRQKDRVTSFPAVQFTYSFIVDDKQWIFTETIVSATRPEGTVSFAGTLWADLANGLAPFHLIHRSGSF